jgi:putative ABC transport system substrate-binding protein
MTDWTGSKTMNRRRACAATLGGMLLGGVAASRAQARPSRLGILEIGDEALPSGEMGAFFDELSRFGIVEGKNLAVDRRFARGDRTRLDPLAAELVALKPDVIFTASGTSGAQAAKKATAAIPIVFDASNDPVGRGLVAGLASPGGNLTGSVLFGIQLDLKRLQILSEVMPERSTIAFLDAPVAAALRDDYLAKLAAAVGRATRVRLVGVDGIDTFAAAFERMAHERVDAISIGASPLTAANRQVLAALVAKYRFPAIADGRGFAEAGLLLTYTTDFVQVYRRAAEYVYRILNGASPATLPVEHPSKFVFVVNLKTARSLGIRIPAAVLVRADAVIN